VTLLVRLWVVPSEHDQRCSLDKTYLLVNVILPAFQAFCSAASFQPNRDWTSPLPTVPTLVSS
jgi:hypothetical protein